MSPTDCERAQEEIDRLLNDPETPISPDRIWALAEAIAAAGCESAVE
jgi:predicted ATPase